MKSIAISADHIDSVLAFCEEVLIEEGFSEVRINHHNKKVVAQTRFSWKSLGESIELNVTQQSHKDYYITINSQLLILQVIDWGVNSKNIDRILHAIQKKINA